MKPEDLTPEERAAWAAFFLAAGAVPHREEDVAGWQQASALKAKYRRLVAEDRGFEVDGRGFTRLPKHGEEHAAAITAGRACLTELLGDLADPLLPPTTMTRTQFDAWRDFVKFSIVARAPEDDPAIPDGPLMEHERHAARAMGISESEIRAHQRTEREKRRQEFDRRVPTTSPPDG